MIRRFNYTDRQRIPRQNVRLIWIEEEHKPLRFQAEIDLELERPLNPRAEIALEAYIGPVVMRFPLGTVAQREHPSETSLTAFAPGQRPSFRVKVIDPSPDKRLLAWADGVNPLSQEEAQSGRKSILPVETVELGDRVWDLRIESNTFFLQLNSSIREPRDITALAKDPDFIALVYPAVIRRALEHLLFGPEASSVDDDNEWLAFSAQIAGYSHPRRDDDNEDLWREETGEWIDAAIRGFCTRHGAAAAFSKFKKELEDGNG